MKLQRENMPPSTRPSRGTFQNFSWVADRCARKVWECGLVAALSGWPLHALSGRAGEGVESPNGLSHRIAGQVRTARLFSRRLFEGVSGLPERHRPPAHAQCIGGGAARPVAAGEKASATPASGFRGFAHLVS